jgi:hypothetical protein
MVRLTLLEIAWPNTEFEGGVGLGLDGFHDETFLLHALA